MRCRVTNEMGDIVISNQVIAKYAGLAAVECSGIVGMAMVSVADGFVKMLKRESLAKGVRIEVENNQIRLDFHVIVMYGVNICAVCDNMIESVKYSVEKFTGMAISKINIFVEGVRVVD